MLAWPFLHLLGGLPYVINCLVCLLVVVHDKAEQLGTLDVCVLSSTCCKPPWFRQAVFKQGFCLMYGDAAPTVDAMYGGTVCVPGAEIQQFFN